MRAWLIYGVGVLAGGATLAPLVWMAVHATFPDSSLAAQPFHRYVHRSLLLLALAGLWPLTRLLQTSFVHGLGVRWGRVPVRNFFIAGGVGFISLGTIALIVISGGGRNLAATVSPSEWPRKIVAAIATALVVALVEETLFRGALFTSLRRWGSWWTAAGWSSAWYALVHFFQRTSDPPTVTVGSGWVVLAEMMSGFIHLPSLFPGFFNLFLAGWILALVRERSGGLASCIGLHAAWIFWLKIYGSLTVMNPEAHPWIWGSEKLVDGWLALVVLGLTLFGVHWGWRHPRVPAKNAYAP